MFYRDSTMPTRCATLYKNLFKKCFLISFIREWRWNELVWASVAQISLMMTIWSQLTYGHLSWPMVRKRIWWHTLPIKTSNISDWDACVISITIILLLICWCKKLIHTDTSHEFGCQVRLVRRGGVVVRASDLQSRGRRFEYRSLRSM